MDVRIKLIPVLFNRELLVVVNGNEDFLSAVWLLLRVVELLNVWVRQCLLCSESLVGIKLKQALE